MEFIEYYRIVKDRVWIVVLVASVAAIIVVVYSVVPPSEYEARGRIRVYGEAALVMTRTGDNAGPSALRDFWYTLFQMLNSDHVLYLSAQEAGITDPRAIDNLKPIKGRQESGSSVARITAWAPTPAQAEALTDAAMSVLREQWDASRLGRVKGIEIDLGNVLSQVEEDLAPFEEQMAGYAEQPVPGTPRDRLATIEARVSSLEGQIQGAEIELILAQDNVASLRRLAHGEMALPLGQQQYGGLLAGELRTLHQALENMRDELARQLEYRTEEHPAVKALRGQIADVEEDIAELRSGEAVAEGLGSPLQSQILAAELAVNQARRRIEVLQAESLNLGSQLPAYRARAEEFGEIATQYARLMSEKSALLRELDELSAERRRLEQTEDIEIMDVAVVQPTGRTIGKTILLLFAGIAGGIVIGILAILLLHYVDLTYKNSYEAERLIGRRVLASIPRTDIMLAPVHEAEPPPEEPGDEDTGAASEVEF